MVWGPGLLFVFCGVVAAGVAEVIPFVRHHDVPIIIVDAHAKVVVVRPVKRAFSERGHWSCVNAGHGEQ
eukprot:4168299-Prorocentrum_lima.AAC.1